jgi:hypothetical protein
MSRTWIFTIYILIDLAIVVGVVWCALEHIAAGKYFIPAVILFVLNGAWLVVMTLKNTPQRPS